MAFDPQEHLMKVRGGQPEEPRRQPKSQEHRAKISAALKAYAARPGCHLERLHRSGEEHQNFKGGIRPSYYRAKAFAAYGRACQDCGNTQHVNVHHKDGNRRNSDIGNLVVLCRSCHNREHGLGGDIRSVTHCPQGHPYTPENTYVYTSKRGQAARACRECRRARNRRWYAQQKERGTRP